MKKLITLLLTATLFLTPAWADFDPETDYLDKMEAAASVCDVKSGQSAEKSRGEKIDALGLELQKINFGDLLLLSKIMYAEAGSSWLSDQWRLCVGEVALNRVASPEFPDTLEEVLYQPGQYYGRNSRYFQNIKPPIDTVELAARLLQGERHMKPAVVFQANFPQGSGTFLKLTDKTLGSSYFCYSSHPELYK